MFQSSAKKVMEDKKNEKIVLTRIGKNAFVFNLEDFIKLRRDYKIVGSVVGTNCVNSAFVEGMYRFDMYKFN